MRIDVGLFPGQVLQRGAGNRARAVFRGMGAGDGILEARVRRGKQPAEWSRAGRCVAGALTGCLRGLPAGGPYGVDLRLRRGRNIVDTLTVPDLYVGDVWFMAGQSNMQGGGNMAEAATPHPLVRCFYMCDEWGRAEDPLHFLPEAVDAVHGGGGAAASRRDLDRQRRTAHKGVGVGVWFGAEMVRRTGVPQGLVACAHGGTSMEQWSPDRKGEGGGSLYGAMLRRFRKLGQPVRGMLWYQGCSEAHPVAASCYTERMIRLVAEVRRDFGQPALPWLMVQIGRYTACQDPRAWNAVQEAQRLLPARIRHLDVVPAADLELDDSVHIGAAGYPRLARRLARIANRLALGNRAEKGAIQPGRIWLRKRTDRVGRAFEELCVRFTNVEGGLRSAGRPNGFSTLNAGGEREDFFACRLEGDTAVMEWPTGLWARVAYGQGGHPYLNITDARDMALPVFGPVAFLPQAGSEYITRWEVAETDLAAGALARLPYPGQRSGLGWRPAGHFIGGGCPWMAMPGAYWEPRRGVYLFRAHVEAETSMTVRLAAGADSPFVAWLNGKEVLRDLSATNPCMPDRYRRDGALRRGTNEILFAFDSRDGKGWGLCLHFLPTRSARRLPDGLRVG